MFSATDFLFRAPVAVPKVLELREVLAELGKSAKEKLGYSSLLYATEAATKTEDATGRVAEVFKKLGIEPFTKESVEYYKQKEARRANKGYRSWERDEWVDPLLGIIGSIATIALIAMFGCNLHDTLYHQNPFAWGWLGIPGSFAVGAFGWLWREVSVRSNLEYSWHSSPLPDYRGVVPAFALSRALELKQELPEASFGIESLQAYTHTKDPFLYMDFGDRRYYLDVWDEPKFEGRRVV